MSTKRSKLKKPKDLHKPKRNQSSYMIWANEVGLHDAKKFPAKERFKIVGARWKAMTDEEKKPYNDKADTLKNEYRLKMAEYKKTKHYKEHENKVKEWKQRCDDIENNNNNNNKNNKNNHKNKNKNENKNEFKCDENNDDQKMETSAGKDVTEWNWYCIIQWLNRIENGKFKHKKYSNIKKLWKESSIRGYELFSLNDLVLRLGGVTDNNDRQIILKNIMTLNQQRKENKEILSKIVIMECDVPDEMCCPISFEIMEEPVLCTVSGHTYEKNIIQEYIGEKGEDPLTRQVVTKEQLVPNRALRDMIQSWKQKHIVSD